MQKIFFIIIMLLPIQTFSKESMDSSAQVRFVTDFYQQVLNPVKKSRQKPEELAFFSESLLKLIANNKEICNEKSQGGEICGFGSNGDIFLNTQESGPDLNFKNSKFKASVIGPNLVEAEFTVWPKEYNYYLRKIQYKLVKEKSSWRVDDMIYIRTSGVGNAGLGEISSKSVRKQIESENTK